ncbi:MAG: methyltransferase domain-containing protein [Clostridia bacterium]|nr:methyltransferase domain-containing protein [Clostridia bacterium]
MNESDLTRAVKEQYASSDNLDIRITIHEKYSINRQGFANWIAQHYSFFSGASVLELGCGTGSFWRDQPDLINACDPLILSDFSAGMLQTAGETLKQYPSIRYRQIDIQDIPFPDRSFDFVIANMMLYHVPDPDKGLREVRRVLKPGGIFYCATYGENGIMDYLCGMFSKYGVSDKVNHTFTLQNGTKVLERYFTAVRREDYPDALAVTHVEDLADYVYSLSGMSALRELDRETLISEFNARTVDGVLNIPKEYGMFIASGE